MEAGAAQVSSTFEEWWFFTSSHFTGGAIHAAGLLANLYQL